MLFQIDEFIRLRPYLYHVTSHENLTVIQKTARIQTSLELLKAACRDDLLTQRRREYVTIETPDGPIVLKDQKPLVANNTALPSGWSFADFVSYLNGFAYFWPGTNQGPIGNGKRLLDHYEADRPLILRISTSEIFAVNVNCEPQFSPFNSGAPRCNRGKKAYRGPDLFSVASAFARRASEVIEVGFPKGVILPTSVQYLSAGAWAGFFT